MNVVAPMPLVGAAPFHVERDGRVGLRHVEPVKSLLSK
jgi:hypothetical protein